VKCTFETEINAPIEKVAAMVGDPRNRTEWMEGLESDQPINGTPGMPGAQSRLVFKTGNMTTTFVVTVTARHLPDEFCQTMEAPNVLTTVTTRLVALSPAATRHISEQDFKFKGAFNKIVGFLLQTEFKKQSLRHLQNFKRFAERP
jgi:hypothetical protein